MRTLSRLALFAALLLALPVAVLAADAALTNADITKMSKAGLGKDLVIAKIEQSAAVDFRLETDDIIALKQSGVHQDVISAMLKRTTAAPAAAGGDSFPEVSLVAASGTTSLAAAEGDHKQFAAPFVGLKHFLVFEGTTAATRIKDRRPTLELKLGKDPGDKWWVVRLDPDDDEPTRGLDLESAGMWGGSHSYEPDEEFVIKAAKTDAGGGTWRFQPAKDLKPGEYALYSEEGFAYDFGVDK